MAHLTSFLVEFLFAIVVLITLLVLYIKYQHTYWQRRGIPTLPSHWFFGNVKDIIKWEKSPAFVIGDLHEKASEDDDVLGIYVFTRPFLLVRNPELVKQILIKDFNYFQNRFFHARSFKDKVGSSSLFSIKNPEWKYLRNKISPVFTSGKIRNTFPLMAQVAESMNTYLGEQFLNGAKTLTVDMKEITLKYTTDIISSVAFGIHVNSFKSETVKFYNEAQRGLRMTLLRGIQITCMFFIPGMSPYLGGQLLGSSTDYFRKVFWDSMNSREASKSKRGDLIDFLLELKNQEQKDGFKFEGDALVGQSAVFFVAGRESSVATICFTLYELAKQPEIQRRAREEIREKLKEQGITYEAVLSMKYLNQVISETLRLYPPAPLLDRVAAEDYKIPETDIVIEKGTPVYVALSALQRDPKYHPDPLRFNPDRFSDENKDKILPGSYMPFGEGPRACIGMRLGIIQSALGIIAVLKDYEVAIDPTYTGLIDIRNVFLSPADGFSLRLSKV